MFIYGDLLSWIYIVLVSGNSVLCDMWIKFCFLKENEGLEEEMASLLGKFDDFGRKTKN